MHRYSPARSLGQRVGLLFLPLIILSTCTEFDSAKLLQRSHTKEFGEPCDKVEMCNHRYWLTCRNGVCECLSPQEMIFVNGSKPLGFFSSYSSYLEAKSCRVRANFGCKRSYFYDDEGNAEEAPPLQKPQPMSGRKQTQLCVPNAYCHSHGVCKCMPDYSVNPENGACIKLKFYGEQCANDADCHGDRFLTCLKSGVCGCHPEKKYDAQSGRCVMGPGEDCQISLGLNLKVVNNCVANATCHLGTCSCVRGYIPDYRKRICVRDYGYYCSESEPCVDNKMGELTCVNRSCVCNQRRRNVYVFDKLKRKCVTLYGINGGRRTPPGGGTQTVFRLLLTLWIHLGSSQFLRAFL